MDGKIMCKTERDPDFNKGSMILATDGAKGLYRIRPDPAGFRPLASAGLLEGSQNWGPIALADGGLLIRDQQQIKCVAVR